MLLNKIAIALAIGSLVAADIIPRTPASNGGCPDGYVLTKKICKIPKPDLCCPTNVENPKLDDYKECIRQLPVGCPNNTFACPDNYGGGCCPGDPSDNFCGTQGSNYVCYTQ